VYKQGQSDAQHLDSVPGPAGELFKDEPPDVYSLALVELAVGEGAVD
jgi:hypothetical protein